MKEWGPGYRYFQCEECDTRWSERCRDCTSQSHSICPACDECVMPFDYKFMASLAERDH